LAAQALRTGHPSPHYRWARAAITRCDVTGPTTVLWLWRQKPPTDRQDLTQLARMAGAFPTREMYDLMQRLAADESAATEPRLIALSFLSGVAERRFSPGGFDMFDPPAGRRPYVQSVTGVYEDSRYGELVDVRGEVQAMLRAIGQRTGDRRVRNATELYLYFLDVTTPRPQQ
jgi:hypothetical protein